MIKKSKWSNGLFNKVMVVLLILLTSTSCSSEGEKFGAPIDAKKGSAVTLNQIFINPAGYEGKNVIVESQAGQVCQTSGCWVMLTDGMNQLFVQFYSFTVRPPKGSTLRVQGVLKLQNKVPFLAGEGLEILR
ncbi:MAG: hypothetical protein FD159_2199 [Syntrophaceae bacterium]|nr:MAG: hypothetical protein FD159_2199 [Syntrophaceae bacterium]